MKAIVKTATGFGNVEIQDVDVPKIDIEDVLVRVKSAGFCGTDMEIYRGEFETVIPVIIGHEFSGEIVEVGKNVHTISVGDRVVSETAIEICGKCFYCRTGSYNLCPERKGLGYGTNGAFAEYVRIPSRTVHKIPNNLTFDEAALCEPLSVATRATDPISKVRVGDTVAVVGPGPIGLLIIQVAKACGASFVINTGARGDDDRLELAKKLGADEVANVEHEDPVEKVRQLTNGVMADIVIEAAGAPRAATQSLELAKRGGVITLVGIYPKPFEADLNIVLRKELRIRGSWSSGVFTDWELALKLLSAKRVQTTPLITHELPLENWKESLKLVQERKAIKVVFHP